MPTIKLFKTCQRTRCAAPGSTSFCHCVFCLGAPKALAFIELPLNNFNSQCFNGSFAVHLFVRTLSVAKMLRQQKTVTFLIRERFSTLCQTLQSCTCSTSIRCNQGQSLSCACVQCQHTSLQYYGRSIYAFLQKEKIKGVP
jgi:hypothetical protein